MITADFIICLFFTIVLFFVSITLVGFAFFETGHRVSFRLLWLGIVFLGLTAYGTVRTVEKYNEGTWNKQYEIKVRAVDEAEKELKKFLIDHPEFENNNQRGR